MCRLSRAYAHSPVVCTSPNSFFLLFRWHGTNLAENEQVITEERQQKGLNLLRHCPVSGAKLSDTDILGNYVYMIVQMDAGVGKNLQGGTFRTASQVCPAPTMLCLSLRVVSLWLGCQ
jgi:hypothetical protein